MSDSIGIVYRNLNSVAKRLHEQATFFKFDRIKVLVLFIMDYINFFKIFISKSQRNLDC